MFPRGGITFQEICCGCNLSLKINPIINSESLFQSLRFLFKVKTEGNETRVIQRHMRLFFCMNIFQSNVLRFESAERTIFYSETNHDHNSIDLSRCHTRWDLFSLSLLIPLKFLMNNLCSIQLYVSMRDLFLFNVHSTLYCITTTAYFPCRLTR